MSDTVIEPAASTWGVRSAACTDTGPVRSANEDSFFRDDSLGLYLVADGLGGHAAGEIASNLAVEAFVGFVSRSQADEDLTWPYGQDPNLTLDENRLLTAAKLAHRRVNSAATADQDKLAGMGTTLVAVLVRKARITFCHAGDSRLYLLEDGADGLARLTIDDVVMIDGAQRPRTALTNAIGIGQFAGVHIGRHDAHTEFTLMLCSDGLHGVVNDDQLYDIVKGPDIDMVAQQLVSAALQARTRDNVTAVVVRGGGHP
jgi:protein phosphatase